MVVYNIAVLIGMTWYTDDSITTVRNDVMLLSVLYMPGAAMNYASSGGNHMHNNNTTTPSSFLSDAGADVAVASPWV